MDEKLYQVATTLETSGYWKNVLPAPCHTRLLEHLDSLDSWLPFFNLSNVPKESADDLLGSQEGEKEPLSACDARNRQLGEDGMLSFRIRIFLLDATLYNSATSSKKDQRCTVSVSW